LNTRLKAGKNARLANLMSDQSTSQSVKNHLLGAAHNETQQRRI